MDQPLKNTRGEKIDYTFAAGAGACRNPEWLILLGHGVTGNKDRPVVADTAAALNEAGFDTLRFSFAGNGASEGAFQESTITREVSDLRAILNVVSAKYPRIAYIGHSMGAAVGVLLASEDPRIQALVSLAGMVDTRKFATTEFGSEVPDEGLMWDDEKCPLSSDFMQDLCETIGSVAPAADSVTVPWLLVHGTADDVVLPEDTRCISELKGDAVDVKFVEGADHSFNEPEHKAAMTTAVVAWMQNQAS